MQRGQGKVWSRRVFFLGMVFGMMVGIRSTAEAGSIVGTQHDFSKQAWSGGQLCVVCHAPHNTNNSVTGAPLWNHQVTTANYQPYRSATLKATVGQPDGVSKLCLSCHDGTVAIDAFGGAPGTVRMGDIAKGADAGHNLGTDLTRDHPISFAYTAQLAQVNKGLKDPSQVPLPFYGPNKDQLECATCHNVHDHTIDDFGRVNNSGSALCLTCHIK
jgi:hypothetical protein